MSKFVILATPRSGSTLLYGLMTHYLEQKFNYGPGLCEYFYGLFDTSFVGTEEYYKRLKAVQTKPIRLCKLFPLCFGEELFDFYNENYTFICLERRDRYEQLLSWALSGKSGIWNNGHARFKTYEKYHLTKEEFLAPLSIMKAYDDCKDKIKNIQATVYYEDLIKFEDSRQGLELAGFSDWKDFMKKPIKEIAVTYNSGNLRPIATKLKNENKEQFFDNDSAELKEWFKRVDI